jgi:hypothetical protein
MSLMNQTPVAALPLADSLQHQNIIFTNVPNAQSFSIRVDSSGNTALITRSWR